MFALNLPAFEAKIAQREGKNVIFDVLRRRYVALTPEEWVRQHFTNFLLKEKGYPQGLLANEIQINLNGTKKRCDTVLYRRDLTPQMIVEYKAPSVEITQAVFDQITRYNMVLKVDYLVVSNGLRHYCCRIDYARNTYYFLPDIPRYTDLQGIKKKESPERESLLLLPDGSLTLISFLFPDAFLFLHQPVPGQS